MDREHVVVTATQLIFQKLVCDQIQQRDRQDRVLQAAAVHAGGDAACADHRLQTIEALIGRLHLLVQRRVAELAEPPHSKNHADHIVHCVVVPLGAALSKLMEIAVEQQGTKKRIEAFYATSNRRIDACDDQRQHKQKIDQEQADPVPRRRKGPAQICPSGTAQASQNTFRLQAALRVGLCVVDQFLSFCVALRVNRGTAQHIVEVLFSGGTALGIDPLEHPIQIKIMPGDFVNQELVQLVVPSIIIIGADIIHIPVKIEGIGDLSERGAQSFFQAHEVLQRNCHFSQFKTARHKTPIFQTFIHVR